MSALDLLDDDFPHATLEGHERGCRGMICPGRSAFGWSCAQALIRFRGDWEYRKRVEAGLGPAAIAELERAEAARVAEAERLLRRAERLAAQPKPAPKLAVVSKPAPVVEGVTRTGGGKGRRWTVQEIKRLRDLHSDGESDLEIARLIGRGRAAVWTKRTALGLPTNPGKGVPVADHGTRARYEAGCRDDAACPADVTCHEAAKAYWRAATARRQERAVAS